MNARHRSTVIAPIVLLVLALVTAAGCGKKAEVETVPTDAAREVGAETARPVPPPPPPRTEVRDTGFPVKEDPSTDPLRDSRSAAEYNRLGAVRTIFFAYDSSELTADARATLSENATWLEAHPSFNVVVEGHCDERGTIEYNLSLGQRRARSVRDYLATLGVNRARMRTVSYGEERPVDRGHDESAWSKNRRAAFTLEDR